MKVKMLVNMSGPDFTRSVGDVLDMDDDEAGRLFAARFAEAVDVAPATEKATASRPRRETRAKKGA